MFVVLSSCTCGDLPAAPVATPALVAPAPVQKPTPRPAPVADVPVVGACEAAGVKLPAARMTTKKAVQASCFSDSWSAETIACFATVTDDAGIAKCSAQLEPAREDWLRYRLGDAENKPAGWACQQLKGLVDEAASCKRFDDDNDPIPEIRDTLAELLQPKSAASDSARTIELRCLAIQRLVTKHIATHACLKKP
jgi:hypothetical protein